MSAIIASEIKTKYSTTAGAAGNSGVGTPTGSLGKYVSTTEWAGGAVNDLFANISGADNAASVVDYVCIFVHNTNSANTLIGAVAWISSEVAGGASIALGVDPTAASAVGASSAQAVTIASRTTAPAGVTFTSPTTQGAGVSLGDIPSGQVKALWIRRTAANSAALSGDGFTLALAGDTEAA